MDKHPDDLLTGDGDPFKGDPNFMASLARGLEVIQAFTPQRPLLSISQISQKTGIPRAAVRRCLYTLSKLGFVYAEDGKNFQLRPRILALGHAWLASTPLARSAQPVLRHLSEMLNESCSIATLDGDDILYIARASSSRIMTIDLDIGSRLPAWATSMGRVLLSHQPEEKLNDMLARVTMIRYTPQTGGFGGEAARRTGNGCISRGMPSTIRSWRWGCAPSRSRCLTLRGRSRRRSTSGCMRAR